MSEHNEPWRVEAERVYETGRSIWNIVEGNQVVLTCYGEDIATRIVLEHDACAGLSAREVREIQDKLKQGKQHLSDADKLITFGVALQSQFDKTMELLDEIYPVLYREERYDLTDRIQNILKHHKESRKDGEG